MEDGYILVVFSAHLHERRMSKDEMIAETAETGRMQILKQFDRRGFERAMRALKASAGEISYDGEGIYCEVYAVGNFISDLYGRPIPGDAYEFGMVTDKR